MKSILVKFLLFFLYFCKFINSQSIKKKIQYFPGYNESLPTNFYTGYIPVANNTKLLHYVFVEAFENSSNAPLIIWMQGGPGASSLLGFFNEIGPFILNQFSIQNFDNNGTPKLFSNPYTWTKHANYIFLESPAGVGFSFCIDTCPINTDQTQADDAYEFIVNFIELFDEYKNNDFYITGESYGGLYVPMLANKIIDNNNEINLKGVLIGNGCTGNNSFGMCEADSLWIMAQFLHGHSQISTSTFNSINLCPVGKEISSECKKLFQQMFIEAGPYYFYNIYDECFFLESQEIIPESLYDYPCYSSKALHDWINHDTVKEIFESEKDWVEVQTAPDGGPWELYKKTVNDVFYYYKKLIENKIKVTIYFGDVDTAVSYIGGELSANMMEMSTKSNWRPWTIDGYAQVAGHVIEYEKDFTFITLRAAGHMVPQNKIKASEILFTSFIQNKTLPYFYNN